MIKLTRIDGSELMINANLIEVVEATPDTVVTLITNKRFMVKESPDKIAEMTVKYYKKAGGPRLIVYANHLGHSNEHPEFLEAAK